MPSVTMGGAEFARYLGSLGVVMTRQAVSKSLTIPKGPDGRVLVAEALAALQAAGRLDRLPGDAAPPEAEPSPAVSMGRPRSSGGGYYEEKAETERVIRELKQIELAKARGELVPVADVRDAQMGIARKVGDRLDQLVTLAPELTTIAATEGEAGVRAYLRERVRALREDMARYLTTEGLDDDDGGID